MFTSAPAAFAAKAASRFTAGESVAHTTTKKPASISAASGRATQEISCAAAIFSISGKAVGAMTVTSAPAAASDRARRKATWPPPTTAQRRPASRKFTGYTKPLTSF